MQKLIEGDRVAGVSYALYRVPSFYLYNSPDPAPSDYHLFPNLKKHLRGQRFSTNDELKYAIEEWLK